MTTPGPVSGTRAAESAPASPALWAAATAPSRVAACSVSRSTWRLQVGELPGLPGDRGLALARSAPTAR